MKKRKTSHAATTTGVLRALSTRYAPIALILFSLSLIFVSSVNTELTEKLRIQAADTMAPVLNAVSAPVTQFISTIDGIAHFTALRTENERLAQENERLRQWYEAALRLEAENRSLQGLLNLTPEPAKRYITARIIADPGQSFVHSFLVLAGAQQNVQKGQAALAPNGMAGRVTEVGKNASRILLITDLNSRIPVIIEGNSDRAILAGDNTEQPKLVHLPHDTGITLGARVVTSGHGGVLPPGLPLGKVASIENGEIRVQPFANLTRLTHLQIVDFKIDPVLGR